MTKECPRLEFLARNSRRGQQSNSLEVEASAELQGTRPIEAGDIAEGTVLLAVDVSRGRHGHIRVGELHVVEQVKRLKANLKLALVVDVDGAEEAGVDKVVARTAELVAMSIGESR